MQLGQQSSPQKHYDEHTIYCDTAVATEKQLADAFRQAILDAAKVLGEKNTCKFKVNLLVDKEGKYFGFGYVRVSDPRVYWMLLGRNPDGSERVEEYPDPNWLPPTDPNTNLSVEEIIERNKNKTWAELAAEEDKYIQPIIKKQLPPLITLQGYEYDEEQRKHLRQLALEEEREHSKDKGKLNEIPTHGYFAIQRGYALDAPEGYFKNKICARNVPDWIPLEAFKSIFSFYVSGESKNKKVLVHGKEETYPLVNFFSSKKGGKIVFVTFDPNSKDAIFALLMTKKTNIVHPQDPTKKTTLIFMHAFENNNQ
jgi:hypothetical protein